METKSLHVGVWTSCYYDGWIDVPDDMTLDEAISYARKHVEKIPVEGDMEYIPSNNEIDEESCYFDN